MKSNEESQTTLHASNLLKDKLLERKYEECRVAAYLLSVGYNPISYGPSRNTSRNVKEYESKVKEHESKVKEHES